MSRVEESQTLSGGVVSLPTPAHLRAKIPPVATVADPIATGMPRGVEAEMRNPPYGIEEIGEIG